MKKVDFATSNSFKVKEANTVGEPLGIEFTQLNQPYPEIRAEEVEKVAEEGAKFVYEKVKQPVIVEDTGLYIKALNGFPGSYSKFVFQKIGNEGILKLLEGKENKNAKFISAVGYGDEEGTKIFVGKIAGKISTKIKGQEGFGYDSIFIPEEREKTFAQDYELKKKISHRKKAVESFCQWMAEK